MNTHQFRTINTRFNIEIAESRAEAIAWLADDMYENSGLSLTHAYNLAAHEVRELLRNQRRAAKKKAKANKPKPQLSRAQKRAKRKQDQKRWWLRKQSAKNAPSRASHDEAIRQQRAEARELGATSRI